MRSIRPKANYLLICLPVFMSIFLMLSCSDRKALSSGDLFPNLIQSGYLAQLMTFTQDEPLFIDASTAASSEGFTLNFQLEYLNLDSYYLFESDLLRDHNVVGVYPEVIFGEQSQILNDFWSQNEKQKMTLILKTPAQLTKETPVRTMSFLQMNIPKENYRLQLENISLKAVKILSTQPENGTIIDQKTINFSWKLLKTDRLLDIKILLSRNKDFTAPNTIEFKTDNRQQSLTIHNNLENGKWYWKIELFHYRTRIACSEIWSFYVKKSSSIQNPSAQTKPIITNLDFFPIAIYGGAAANLKELRKIGFNAVQLSGHGFENTVELLNTAHRNGLKALLPLPPQDLNLEELYKSRPGLRSLLFSEAVLAWYLADEPEGRSVSPKIIKDRLDFLRKNGFTQPGVIALARPWRALDYAPGVNVFMSDQYPIPFNPLSWLSESLDTVEIIITLDPEKRSWAVIQAFGWQYSSPQARATGLARNPTPEEVKALTYLAITHGARGIFYYTYKGGQYNIKEHPKLWEGVKETVGELRDISSILLAPEADENISMECESKDEWGYPAVHYILKKDTIYGKDNESLYLIAVNTLNRKVFAKFKFKDPLKDSSLELDFLPLERKVLRIPT